MKDKHKFRYIWNYEWVGRIKKKFKVLRCSENLNIKQNIQGIQNYDNKKWKWGLRFKK